MYRHGEDLEVTASVTKCRHMRNTWYFVHHASTNEMGKTLSGQRLIPLSSSVKRWHCCGSCSVFEFVKMTSNAGYDAFTSNFKDKQGIPHETTLDLKGSLLEEAFTAVSPILEQSLKWPDGRIRYTNCPGQCIILLSASSPNRLSLLIVHTSLFTLSSPVIIFVSLHIPQSAPLSLVLSHKVPSLTQYSPSRFNGTQSILAGT